MLVQLPLNIELKKEATFSLFVAEEELIAMAVANLQQLLLEPKSNFTIIHGQSYSGKTHLLQSSCRFFKEKNTLTVDNSAVYLPLADKSLPFTPAILAGLELVDLICIDDVDKIIGNNQWELALANLINKSQALGKKILISSLLPVEKWNIISKELYLAIIVSSTIKVTRITQQYELIEVLEKRSRFAGFELPVKISDYLIQEFPNNLLKLIAILQKLEKASIVHKKKLNLAFVKRILHK